MAARFAQAAVTTAVIGIAVGLQKHNTSYAESKASTFPLFKGAGAESHVGQVGQNVKNTEQGNGSTLIDGNVGHPEALKILEKVAENTNQYGLAAIREFAAAQAYSAEAAKVVAKTHRDEMWGTAGILGIAGIIMTATGAYIIRTIKEITEKK